MPTRILPLLLCLCVMMVPTISAAELKVALVGDSTVCVYPKESRQRGWGESLPEFLTADAVVINEAKPGASTKNFPAERWDRVRAAKPDFILIQFGHNDSHAKGRPESTDAATDYRDNLRRYVQEARATGARPILVTPVHRRTFLPDGTLTTELKPYADAMNAVAAELSVPVIDLHELSGELYRRLGEDGSTAFTINHTDNADRPGKLDRTHFTAHGAREMARLVATRLCGIDSGLCDPDTMTRAANAVTTHVWQVPPGWTQTRGGEGGRVLRVTTLAADGPGSLAEALAASGPRIIEFSVAGVVDLGGRSLLLQNPFATIAGETAPAPGVTLTNGGMNIATRDVVVRHIRIRPGAQRRERKSGWDVDGLSVTGSDVIVDHCSFAWATDENLSASGPRFEGETPEEWRRNTSHRVTFSNNIVAEGLLDSAHAKGRHSMGSLIHDNVTDIAIHGNLYISNNRRNPFFKGGSRGAVVNNLIHNPGQQIVHFSLNTNEWGSHPWERGAMVIVGNVARRGPSTAAGALFLDARGPVDLYLADNLMLDTDGSRIDPPVRLTETEGVSVGKAGDMSPRVVVTAPFWPPGLKSESAENLTDKIFANVGARPWDRDPTDHRLIQEARTGGGRIIDYESELGGLAGR